MSFKVAWDTEKKVLRKIYTGDIKPEEWAESNKEMFAIEAGAAFKSARFLVVDYADATMKTVMSQDVRSVVVTANEVKTMNPRLILIWVVPSKLEYGLTRVFQALTEGISWETHTVYSRQEAESLIEKHRAKGS